MFSSNRAYGCSRLTKIKQYTFGFDQFALKIDGYQKKETNKRDKVNPQKRDDECQKNLTQKRRKNRQREKFFIFD